MGEFVFEPNDPNDSYDTPFTNSLAVIWANRVQHLSNFASAMATLQSISDKELAHTPLASNEVLFLQGIVEDPGILYTGARTYSGWYPGLFYQNSRALHSADYSSDRWDPLVTDVHTDPPEPLVNDTGSVLHEGVGNVQLLMIAVDCGAGRRRCLRRPRAEPLRVRARAWSARNGFAVEVGRPRQQPAGAAGLDARLPGARPLLGSF